MPGAIRFHTAAVFAGLLLGGGVSLPAQAQVRFDIPAESLAQALRTVGIQANLNVYFDPPLVRGLQAPQIKAEMSADDALAKLLAGTRLRAVRVDQNTIRVVTEPAPDRARG